MWFRGNAVGAAMVTAILTACASPSEDAERYSASIIYGEDHRREYFETDTSSATIMATSVVALIPKAYIKTNPGGLWLRSPTWRESSGVCAHEPFSAQPAAAFCSGVLVDWDLVLTAGHCVRQFALNDFLIAFGYYYRTPDRLALSSGDLYEPVEIASEELNPPGWEPRLDYAWLRLAQPVRAPRRPAAVQLGQPALKNSEAVVTYGTPGGVPGKSDAGGKIRDARLSVGDFFLADTDTSYGCSGGGAFVQDGTLLGILARGGMDLVTSPAGCRVTFHEPDGSITSEQFTYVHRAVEGLCKTGGESSLCRPDCGNPCLALPPTEIGGCAVTPRGSGTAALAGPILLALVAILVPITGRPLRAPRRGARSGPSVRP